MGRSNPSKDIRMTAVAETQDLASTEMPAPIIFTDSAAAKVAGSGFYFLTGAGALLEMALVRYGLLCLRYAK
mgnify:CR=1 FL=1